MWPIKSNSTVLVSIRAEEMKKRKGKKHSTLVGGPRKSIRRAPYTKNAVLDPVVRSIYCKHLGFKFQNMYLTSRKLIGERGCDNPYNQQALGFGSWWKKDLARVSGGGMPGTANMNGRLIIAYIFWRCLGRNAETHWSFTDVGCAEVSV